MGSDETCSIVISSQASVREAVQNRIVSWDIHLPEYCFYKFSFFVKFFLGTVSLKLSLKLMASLKSVKI